MPPVHAPAIGAAFYGTANSCDITARVAPPRFATVATPGICDGHDGSGIDGAAAVLGDVQVLGVVI